jgi:hypothetical protein
MNEAMKQAWLEINQMMGVSSYSPEELDVFLRTWQRAIQAEREECAKACDSAKAGEVDWDSNDWNQAAEFCASRIRARGQA